jgi:hypothetical protein
LVIRPLITVLGFLLCVAGLALCAERADGQQWVPPRHQHAWGSFPVGSWKRVRVTTTEYTAGGGVASKSTTTTRSELEAADDKGFTLRVKVTVEVAGRRFESQAKPVHQSYGSRPNASTKVSTRRITIGDRTLHVDVHRWTVKGGNRVITHTVYLTPGCSPYVVKRHSRAASVEQDLLQFETWVDVTQLNAVTQILGVRQRVWHVRTVQEHDKQRTTIQEVHCMDVPGAVVSHKSESRDKTGTLVQSSSLELVEYRVTPASAASAASASRGRLFSRRRRGNP